MNWPTVALGDVASIDRQVVTPDQISIGTTYIGLEHIARGGRITGRETIGDFSVASAKHLFSQEHILYGKLRPNLGKIAMPGLSGVCSTDILPIRVSGEVDLTYLFHYLSQPRMVQYAANRASGANLPRLSPTELLKFPVPFPSLHEQRRIAEILDRAALILETNARLISSLSHLVQAVFDSRFQLEESPIAMFGDIVESLEGGKNIVGTDPHSSHPYRVLKISSVTSGQFKPRESKPLPVDYIPPQKHFARRGDILMSRANTRELVGATALVEDDVEDLVLPDKLWRLVWRDESSIEPLYMLQLLQSPATRRALSDLSSGSGGSMKNISKAKLMTMPLPVASLDKQREFVLEAMAIHGKRRSIESRAQKLTDLWATLQYRAFRGEL